MRRSLVTLMAILSVFFGSTETMAQQRVPVKFFMSLNVKEEAGDFNQPYSLFLNEHNEQLIVSDTGKDRLLFFDTRDDEFKFLGEFNADGAMSHPVGVVQDNQGRLYVTERGKNGVTIYDRNTNSKDVLALGGISDNIPTNLAMDMNGNLYVLERGYKRILVFDPGLGLKSQISVSGQAFTGFSDIAVDKNGRIYALETLTGKIYVFDPQGKLINKFGKLGTGPGDFDFPTSIALDPHGNIYVVDQHKHKVLVFNSQGVFQWEFGQFGWKEGSLYFPTYIFIDSLNRVFILERYINRIQIFAPIYRKTL